MGLAALFKLGHLMGCNFLNTVVISLIDSLIKLATSPTDHVVVQAQIELGLSRTQAGLDLDFVFEPMGTRSHILMPDS